jgi:hypothetical protein
MTVTTEAAPTRREVWFRRNLREPWTLLVSSGDRDAAERLLVAMAAEVKVSGD